MGCCIGQYIWTARQIRFSDAFPNAYHLHSACKIYCSPLVYISNSIYIELYFSLSLFLYMYTHIIHTLNMLLLLLLLNMISNDLNSKDRTHRGRSTDSPDSVMYVFKVLGVRQVFQVLQCDVATFIILQALAQKQAETEQLKVQQPLGWPTWLIFIDVKLMSNTLIVKVPVGLMSFFIFLCS